MMKFKVSTRRATEYLRWTSSRPARTEVSRGAPLFASQPAVMKIRPDVAHRLDLGVGRYIGQSCDLVAFRSEDLADHHDDEATAIATGPNRPAS